MEYLGSLKELTPIVAVVVVFAILIVIFMKAVLNYMRDKDTRFIEHINKKDEQFTQVINNHLGEDKALREKMVGAFSNLEKVIERLVNK